MEKVILFEVCEDNGATLSKVFFAKPSIDDLRGVCSHFGDDEETKEAFKKVLECNTAYLEKYSASLSISCVDFIDNAGVQQFKGESGIRLVTQFRYDDEVESFSQEELESFFCKLAEEECDTILADEETGYKFNHIKVQDFLDFYSRYKEGSTETDFTQKEVKMVERIYRLISIEKPSYVKNSLYVRFV